MVGTGVVSIGGKDVSFEELKAKILEDLGLKAINPGSCWGPKGWQKGGSPLRVYSPIDNKVIAFVGIASRKDYDKVLSEARRTFDTWRMVPAPKRGEVIRRIGQALRDKKEPLGGLVTLEMGKIKQEGLGEVQEMIDICDFSVGLSRQLYGLTMHSERPMHRMYEQWHPLGIVGVISAFNFPVAVWSWNAMLALACGDTVVWKPSSKTPLCAVAVQNIVNDVMADMGYPGIMGYVVGPGSSVGEWFINDKRISLISATGSCSMGKRVAEAASKNFTRTILELGGNNAIIVTEDADLDLALMGILFGAVGTAGQRCTSTRRIFLQKAIATDLTERLVDAYGQVKIGNPFDAGTLMGPLVEPGAVDIMQQAIAAAKKQGAKVLFGGERLPEMGETYVRPCLIKARNSMPIVQEETFAPMLYIMEYDKIEDAFKQQNAVPQGLSSSMFTRNLIYAEKFLSAKGSDCGIANINIGTSGAEIGGAFGGEKETGGGRESGSDAWKAYMRRQTNTINWSPELPLAQGIKFGISKGKSKK
jgi:aldehyde dehydrogenase (NAD+)